MALSLIKLPKPMRAEPGSGQAAEAPVPRAFDPVAARTEWLDAVRALARAAAQADHDAAIRSTGRSM